MSDTTEIERLRKLLSDTNTYYAECIAEREELRAENEKLRAALKDCASDLEAEIRGRYTGGGGWDIHPSLVKKFERDMSTVRAAAAALKETGDE